MVEADDLLRGIARTADGLEECAPVDLVGSLGIIVCDVRCLDHSVYVRFIIHNATYENAAAFVGECRFGVVYQLLHEMFGSLYCHAVFTTIADSVLV